MSGSMSQQNRPKHVAIIGGGIAGLAAAHRLLECDSSLKITILESKDRLGGLLKTARNDGFLIEDAADNFITQVPWAVDLCRRLGLADELIPTNSEHRGADVVCRGKLQPIPAGFVLMASAQLWPILKTPILSWSGKLRLAMEPFVPARTDSSDESLGDFACRRLGKQVYERLVQPMVGGIYGSDPYKISLQATVPRFAEMEREHGSLFRAMRHQAKEKKRQKKSSSEETSDADCPQHGGARYSLFTTLRQGMGHLIETLVAKFAEKKSNVTILQNSPVKELLQQKDVGGWSIIIDGANKNDNNKLNVDAVILATPAYVTAQLLQDIDAPIAAELAQIRYRSSTLVTLGYRASQFARPLNSFGFVVPATENRPMLSASFSSLKYADRAPEEMVQIRVFFDGGGVQSLGQEPSDDKLIDEKMIAASVEQLADLLPIQGSPIFSHLVHHPQAMPKYEVGHLERVERIEERLRQHTGLAVAGAAYRGVGVPHCIHNGEQAAEQILQQ